MTFSPLFPPPLQTPTLFYPTTKRISALNPRDYADRVTLVPTITTAEIEGETPESSSTGKRRRGCAENRASFIYNGIVTVAAGRHRVRV